MYYTTLKRILYQLFMNIYINFKSDVEVTNVIKEHSSNF